jgi:hypothetical protein
MSSPLGSVEIYCDAPPYPVVQACRYIGIQSPEGVRWLRMNSFRNWQPSGHQGLLSHSWKMFWKTGERAARTCTCGQTLPELRLVLVTFNTGNNAFYLVAQCSRCRSVFWDAPCQNRYLPSSGS